MWQGNVTEQVVAEVNAAVTAENSSLGMGSMKRIKKRARWMKDYVI